MTQNNSQSTVEETVETTVEETVKRTVEEKVSETSVPDKTIVTTETTVTETVLEKSKSPNQPLFRPNELNSQTSDPDTIFRTKSDFYLMRAKAEMRRGHYEIQKRHTDIEDTPYNTEPIQGTNTSFSSDQSSFLLLQQRSSLGTLSVATELDENPHENDDNIFSIQDESSHSNEANDDEEDDGDSDKEPNTPFSVSL
ncbi:hypothetical protein G6F46_005242 [Rhizopus delemar]|uniref:Uncharacterized protein n=2 Tax=Rhizopus TaxID=4842 RepID=A0A9P7CQJ4_9FUNG|nr:hypothetical protein G6F55_004141 [Rhizopus delemar]KAG1545612.1 hypothetical protein G6F51_005365 [Rhizopus arrhizus]KAG1498706.1 hypothetical protein G6F54_004898 [Rhizopus delemar]KAG1512967.1 hypothetical protein G6F53_004782 [Rhizopus delemar]KAG1527251.1 hypothetical protein G6F52_001699 [Rhizopus delemar]